MAKISFRVSETNFPGAGQGVGIESVPRRRVHDGAVAGDQCRYKHEPASQSEPLSQAPHGNGRLHLRHLRLALTKVQRVGKRLAAFGR